MLDLKWYEVKEFISKLHAEAREDAKKSFSCVRSRGTHYAVETESGSGDDGITSADCWEVSKTKKGFLEDLEIMNTKYKATKIWFDVGYDGGDSPHDFNNFDYCAWAGEASKLFMVVDKNTKEWRLANDDDS